MIKFIMCSLLLLTAANAQTPDCKNDWPNLARYDKDNKSVAAPAKNEQRVVFRGDSITDSWDNPGNGFFPGKPYINRGTYLDYFSAMVDASGFLKNELSDDGLHPNVQGYAVMAPLAQAAIDASLKRGK